MQTNKGNSIENAKGEDTHTHTKIQFNTTYNCGKKHDAFLEKTTKNNTTHSVYVVTFIRYFYLQFRRLPFNQVHSINNNIWTNGLIT